MKTYEFGLAHANSYRALKGHTNKVLAPFKITAFEWALLGLLNESKDGLRVTALAEAISVSKAMISRTCKKLEGQNWINQSERGDDKRAVTYVLTSEGKISIHKVEAVLREDFKKIFAAKNKIDLLMFYRSSTAIAKKLQADIDESKLL